MRLYAHLFLGRACEAPGCDREDCDLYLIPDTRCAVRACCGEHARQAIGSAKAEASKDE